MPTLKREIDLQEWTYGVEFECAMPSQFAPTLGYYHRGQPIADLGNGWKAEQDGSVGGFSGSYKPLEIVSPKLKGVEGLREIKRMLAWAQERKAEVNHTCGFHMHFNWPRSMEADDLRRVVHRVANAEKALYATTGTHSRESGMYSLPIKELYRRLDFRSSGNPDLPRRNTDGHNTYRRRVLNMTNLTSTDKRTLEFRYASGTLRYIKVVAHICMAIGLIEKALANYIAKYDAKGGWVYDRKGKRGPGEAEVCRVLYSLGWIKGRSKRVYGDMTQGASDLPSIKDMHAEMIRLARKYDTETTTIS